MYSRPKVKCTQQRREKDFEKMEGSRRVLVQLYFSTWKYCIMGRLKNIQRYYARRFI